MDRETAKRIMDRRRALEREAAVALRTPPRGIPKLHPDDVDYCPVCGHGYRWVEVKPSKSTYHHAGRNYPCAKRTEHIDTQAGVFAPEEE